MIPPAGVTGPPSAWPMGPVLGLKDAAVNVSGARGISIENMMVVDARGVGVLAADVVDVHIRNVTSALHARQERAARFRSPSVHTVRTLHSLCSRVHTTVHTCRGS